MAVVPDVGDGQISRNTQRWVAFGPYYAMFPVGFVREVVLRYSTPGTGVLDPFVGRGTTTCVAAELGRYGLGIEINPVPWLYGHVKLYPAPMEAVLRRLEDVGLASQGVPPSVVEKLPEFFQWAFAPRVLRFLLEAQNSLRWEHNRVDATLMAFILVYLHGKLGEGLSNQMRQTKAFSPPYAVRWWRARGLTPPQLDPVAFLARRIRWRYRHGRPCHRQSAILRGDARTVLRRQTGTYHLLLTSPPYFGVTSYYYDQWLRQWMLGGPAYPTTRQSWWHGRFDNQQEYRSLLLQTFEAASRLLTTDATVYVRCDARPSTFDVVMAVLTQVFPRKRVTVIEQPYPRPTQTALFGDKSAKLGERDIILQ